MSDILELIKSKFFLIACILVLVAGVIYVSVSSEDTMFIAFGASMILIGFVLLISGYITPIVSESKPGMGIGAFLLIGALVAIFGVISIGGLGDLAYPLMIGGTVVTGLACLAWPCICCQGTKAIRAQIIGVASAHDSITISELSNVTGATVKLTSEIMYDAIGKRELSGRMEGDTFVRSAPSTYSAPTTTTKEREIVKVLVICPYCGAKTEQGIGKCQNCQADL